MAAEEQVDGLVFHPMEQFVVKPLFGDGCAVNWYTPTNATLWMALAAWRSSACWCSAPAWPCDRAEPPAVHCRTVYGMVRKMVEDITGRTG